MQHPLCTYEFIDAMIASAARIFRSRTIHIGCDEAWNLGLGNYFWNNGLRPKAEILREHLERVMAIVRKYNFTPMMWSDMFFRAESPSVKEEYHIPPGGHFSEATKQSVPQDTQLVYWEYIRDNESIRQRLNLHLELTDNLAVAGHIRLNRSVGANYSLTFRAAADLLPTCKAHGIRHVIATVWGDNGPESHLYGALLGMQLYAEYQYRGTVDGQAVYAAFQRCVHAEPNDFAALRSFDEIPAVHGEAGNEQAHNPSRWLLWQDPLLGLFDWNVKDLDLEMHYQDLAVRMNGAAERNVAFQRLFEYYSLAAQALATKALLGVRLYEAYQEGDKRALSDLAYSRIAEARQAIAKLYRAHYELWQETYMDEGWEIFDIRYGGLLARLDTVQDRLIAFLDGENPAIPELERTRLPYNGKEGLMLETQYTRMVSASNL
jgi:hypothetical protein